MLETGQIFAHFKILDKIGEGGMGAVYLAEDQKLHRKVAIKILLPEAFDNDEKQERFKREAKTAAQISHGNVMSIYDIGTAKDEKSGKNIDYIVMEHIEGKQLSIYFQEKSFALNKIVRIAEKICTGLAAAHKLHIVHRDIKADNIMIDEQGEPKILDFGLAKPIEPIFKDSDNDNTDTAENDLTKAGKIIGTVTYMSPEQAKGERVDMRSDIFSFGILLYRMATGEFPFSGPTQVSTLAKILETRHEPPRTKNSNIPAELERIIDKCLQKNCEDRYRDTRDLVVDLRNLRRQYDSGFTDTISTEIKKPATVTKTVEIKLPKKPIWAVGIIAAAVLVFWLMFDSPTVSVDSEVQAKGSSLAILGFENKTGDAELDWLETGLPEILVTDLIQAQSVQIISQKRVQDCFPPESRNEHTFDECVDAAGTLGAVHVLSGSYYKLGDKIRIDARIVEVKSGNIIKTQKVIGSDPFELIDSLTAKIVIALDMQDEFQDNKSVSQYTSSPEAYKYYLEGMELFGLGTDDLEIELFNKAIEIDSSFAMPYLRIAMTRFFSGRLQEGLEYLNMAKERESSLPFREKTLLNVYSEIWIKQNYNDGYIKMESFINQFPDDKEGQTIFGLLVNVLKQDTAKAFEHFDKALEIDPAFQLALVIYTEINFQNNNYDRALEFANRSIKYHPNSPDAYRFIANINDRLGNTDEAIQAYLDVLDKFPKNADILDNLYIMYIKKKDFKKSRQYVEMLRRYHSDDNILMSNYYYHMANLSMWEGNFKQWFSYREKAHAELLISKDSSLISTGYYATASFYYYFEKYDEAIKYFKKGNNWNNSFQRFTYYLTLVQIDSSHAPKLRPELISALDNFKSRIPSNLWFITDNILGRFDAFTISDTAKIIELLVDMNEKNPQVNSLRNIGRWEVMFGEHQKGLDKLLPFAEKDKESSNAYTNLSLQFNIAYAYEHLGNTKEAIKRYEEVLHYWGNADIEIKLLKDTKERLAKLTS